MPRQLPPGSGGEVLVNELGETHDTSVEPQVLTASGEPVLGSVVIPCLNSAGTIGATLGALKTQSIASRLEVIVVDNGSADESVSIARAMGACVLVSKAPGSAAARNLGVSHCTANMVLSLDADCVPSDGLWAERHIVALTTSAPEVLGTAGATVPMPHPDRWSQRADVTPQPAWSATGDPLYAVAGNACYRREILLYLGGFPPAGADDAALGAVARQRGFCFTWVPEARVLHRNPRGWLAYLRQMTKVGYYAAELSPPPKHRSSFYLSQCRRLASALRPLRRGELRESAAIVLKTIGQVRGARSAWTQGNALNAAGASIRESDTLPADP